MKGDNFIKDEPDFDPEHLAKRFDNARSQHDVLNTLSLLTQSVRGMSAQETLAYVRSVDAKEVNGQGADVTIKKINGIDYLEISSPFSNQPIKARLADKQ